MARNYGKWRVIGKRPTINGPMGGKLTPEDAIFGDNVRFPHSSADKTDYGTFP